MGDKSTGKGNAVLVLLAMVVGTLIGLMTAKTIDSDYGARNTDRVACGSKFDEVLRMVEDEYVDSIDCDTLGERLLSMMLDVLDPHSSYLSAKATAHADEMMRGNFEGVGFIMHYEGDTAFVGRVIEGGPSDGIGVLPGDMIWKVDGERVSGVKMSQDSVVARLRGPRWTTVEVEVVRLGEHLTFKIRRGVVEHTTIACARMLDDTTGYVKLSKFSSTSHNEFRNAVRRLKRQGMRRLIFDLRGNGGGSLSSAVGIANEMLPKGSLIVYTQGAHSPRQDIYARMGGSFVDGEVVVMVDEFSASASEVVSGALQDNDRALIVGHRTFGKGLVQTEFNLDDGSAVLLTTARYYTPSGRCIQRPYDKGTDEYYRSYIERMVIESFSDSAMANINDTTPYHTVGGRIVYGGGGIVPDRLLTHAKDESFVYFNQLGDKDLYDKVAFDYVRRHAAELTKRYGDMKAFKAFKVPESMVEQLVRRGEEAGVKCNRASLAKQRRLIESMLKGHVGAALFGDEAFYDSYISQDDELKTVINMKGI